MSIATREAGHAAATIGARRRVVRREAGTWGLRILLIALCFLVLSPAILVLSASVQPGSSAFASSLIPNGLTLKNYQAIVDLGFWTWARNSMIICTVAAVVQLVSNTLGAYAFSRLRFRGRKLGLMALALIQMFPNTLSLSAIFALLVQVNLLDTLLGIILVFIGGSAFYIWLLKNYMDTIPRELDESAIVDGASSWRIFWSVLLPLMRPMLATQFIFSFQGIFSDYIFSSTILQSNDNQNISVGLTNLIRNNLATNWAQFSAGAVMASVPILLVYLLLQRQLVSGLAAGAVKG